MKFLTYAWRLIRPLVYSSDQYVRLAETNPGELTIREVRAIQAFAQEAGL